MQSDSGNFSSDRTHRRSYEAAKRALARFENVDDMKQLSAVSSFVAGGIAGGVSQFSVYPRTLPSLAL